MSIRLLLLSALCYLAAGQATQLVIVGSSVLVEMDEGKGLEPMYLLNKLYIVRVQCTMALKNNLVLSEPSIVWHKFGSNATLDSRYEVSSSLSADNKNFTSVLSMRRMGNEDIVNYTCTGSATNAAAPVTAVSQVLSRPLISFTEDDVKTADVAIWPGDSVTIKCIVDGNPRGSAEWLKEANGQADSMANSSVLNLTSLTYDKDRGFLSCRSHNMYGMNSAKIFLRVKHPQAYLTPLLIIVGEVVVIALIVAGYEFYLYKRRSARQQQDSQGGAAYKTE